ncbi:MAG: SpoIIE family protein phosphatase [Litoreibacter sp.]
MSITPLAQDKYAETTMPRRVLIVDDSRVQRTIVANALNKWNYTVFEATSGREALDICEQEDIDLIISDWVMPGMDGLEFCKAFRSLDRSQYGYFILLTSKAESSEIAHGLEAGADDFLTKPVRFGELRARLRAGERILQMQSELIRKNDIVSVTLKELQTLHENLDKDLREARNLQQSLLKETFVELPGASVSLFLQSCGHVGGDLVGQFKINHDMIGIFSLDVSGHGVASALMTARLSSYLSSGLQGRNIAILDGEDGFTARDPAETAALLNNILLEELNTEQYFTMNLAIVHLRTGKTRCVQAGHPHPILQKANGDIQLLGSGGIPIGLIPGAEFESFDIQLNPGDRLLMYSDGVTESENMGGQFLDEDGLIRILKGNNVPPGPEFVTNLMSEVQAFSGTRDQTDDISALVLDFTGERRQSAGDRRNKTVDRREN